MAYAYLCIGPHGVWTKDGTRYLVKGDQIETLDGIPTGMHRRFAVIEVPDPEPAFTPKAKAKKTSQVEVSDD